MSLSSVEWDVHANSDKPAERFVNQNPLGERIL